MQRSQSKSALAQTCHLAPIGSKPALGRKQQLDQQQRPILSGTLVVRDYRSEWLHFVSCSWIAIRWAGKHSQKSISDKALMLQFAPEMPPMRAYAPRHTSREEHSNNIRQKTMNDELISATTLQSIAAQVKQMNKLQTGAGERALDEVVSAVRSARGLGAFEQASDKLAFCLRQISRLTY